MMADHRPISKWIAAVKTGVAGDAEQGLWEEYFGRLYRLARLKLRDMPVACEDGEDAAISAMKSFFRRIRVGQFPQLQDRTELWPLLVQTTLWKVKNLQRRHLTQARDMRRTISLDWLMEHEPTAELADKVMAEGNALLESLTDEKLQSVAVLKLEGYTNTEIAKKIGRSVKTVEWRLKQTRKQLLAAMQDERNVGQFDERLGRK